MKGAILNLAAVMAVPLVAATPSLAHHSRAMFDMAKNVTYQGIVKEYEWQNPHTHIVITVGSNAKDPSSVGTWDVEASSINVMLGGGWSAMTYKAGDPITLVGHPTKNTSKTILLFYTIRPDGTRLYRAQHRYPLENE